MNHDGGFFISGCLDVYVLRAINTAYKVNQAKALKETLNKSFQSEDEWCLV